MRQLREVRLLRGLLQKARERRLHRSVPLIGEIDRAHVPLGDGRPDELAESLVAGVHAEVLDALGGGAVDAEDRPHSFLDVGRPGTLRHDQGNRRDLVGVVVDDLERLVKNESLAGNAPVERLNRVLEVLDPELVLLGQSLLPVRSEAVGRPASVGFGTPNMEIPVSRRLVPSDTV